MAGIDPNAPGLQIWQLQLPQICGSETYLLKSCYIFDGIIENDMSRNSRGSS